MSTLSGMGVPAHNPKLAWREMDGEIVIISPEDSVVHELNESASIIWKEADGVRDIVQIAERLAQEFEVSLEQARADAAEMVAFLVGKNLLTLAPADQPR
jgi:Coenzyme PQQ synthesis protein D (PqqD)